MGHNGKIVFKLPDGTEMQFPKGSNVQAVAEKIGPGLAKSALAAKLNGRLISLGEPVNEGGDLRILTFKDEEGREVFWHSSAHLMAQAVKRLYPEAQLGIGPSIDDGFYYTGDMGFVDADGYLFIEARRTDLIVTGGENVNPNEVEKRLIEHPGIVDAAVFPLKDDDWGEIVAAAIVLKDEKDSIEIDELQEFLKNDLAGFKIPKKLFVEKELPRNELEKILRSKLIEKYEGN